MTLIKSMQVDLQCPCDISYNHPRSPQSTTFLGALCMITRIVKVLWKTENYSTHGNFFNKSRLLLEMLQPQISPCFTQLFLAHPCSLVWMPASDWKLVKLLPTAKCFKWHFLWRVLIFWSVSFDKPRLLKAHFKLSVSLALTHSLPHLRK